ncbi:MAG: hypothetical protein AUG45_08095 [Ktedonobacter sp. 13_1_20CM_3_54_15]|nr:MAG: hypothetical protein AUH05_14045 [Ktedonobacter sp. 13_2_20CM_53_11]OLB55205.1 MAG: hypothetical protein AUI01_08470 [Ktedonobacter sp. 13_2_20CM_2_56_8]OLE06068.1 MAG: hypothetical protein AUG82_04020 [Ktedonobacter sp. 13_1_20CM_4_53_11]OLE33173.1 MAG: hypothetical protein AUG45_08095 [Ktedonobacter sp. 13_1_20CM_3_54_15]
MALREDVSAFAAANDFPANPGNTLLFFRCLKTPVLFFLGGAKVEMNPTQAPNKERHFHPQLERQGLEAPEGCNTKKNTHSNVFYLRNNH